MDQSYVEELPQPWERESPMTRELLVDGDVNGKNRFHAIDPWHCIHLGIGKTWTACGVIMLQRLVPGSNQEERIANFGAAYKAFCKRCKLDPILRKIDLHTFGTATEPIGCWSKASVTSNWMMFLEDFCREHWDEIQGDQRLHNFVSCLPFMVHKFEGGVVLYIKRFLFLIGDLHLKGVWFKYSGCTSI